MHILDACFFVMLWPTLMFFYLVLVFLCNWFCFNDTRCSSCFNTSTSLFLWKIKNRTYYRIHIGCPISYGPYDIQIQYCIQYGAYYMLHIVTSISCGPNYWRFRSEIPWPTFHDLKSFQMPFNFITPSHG